MRPADTWKDYELLDATDGNRLERWGETLLIRPDPQIIARLIPGIKHYTPIWSADEIPSSSERQDNRHIILDSGLLSYREIIETIQSKSDVRNHFLIYTPDSEIIISPQQTYTKP